MNPTIPVKVREAIVLAQERGLTYAQTADLLGIGEATVSRVLRRHRESGSVAPRPRGGGNFSPIAGPTARVLESLLADAPDLTVAEIAIALNARCGIATSRSAVQRALHRLGYSQKKSRSSRASGTPRSTGGSDAPMPRSSLK